jgi:hypothetical protein
MLEHFPSLFFRSYSVYFYIDRSLKKFSISGFLCPCIAPVSKNLISPFPLSMGASFTQKTYLYNDMPRQLIDDHLLLLQPQCFLQLRPQRRQIPLQLPDARELHVAASLLQGVDWVLL